MLCKKCNADNAHAYTLDTDAGLHEAILCRTCYENFIQRTQGLAVKSGVTLQPIVEVSPPAATGKD
jgi:hypothetical protein